MQIYQVVTIEENEERKIRTIVKESSDYIEAYNFMILEAVKNLDKKYTIISAEGLA